MTEGTIQIDLSNGYAVLRTTRKLSDIAEQRRAAAQRGFEDGFFDSLVLVRERLIDWSFEVPVTDKVKVDETLMSLDYDDGIALFQAVNRRDDGNPNSSSTSPLGTAPSPETSSTAEESPPSSGE